MTEQTNLFEAPTHARRKDPSTSHDAAELVEKTGSGNKKAQVVLKILQTFGPCTTKEVSAYSDAYINGVDYETAHKRMDDLKKANLVELTGDRRGGCRVWRAKNA